MKAQEMSFARIGRLSAVVCMSVVLAGCPPPYIVRLYNNTGTDVVVYLADGNWIWRNGSEIRAKNFKVYLGENGKKTDLETLYGSNREQPLLRLGYGNRISVYNVPQVQPYVGDTLPERYDVSAIIGPQYNFQLQPDGRIYAVQRGDEFPAKMLEYQPLGYPIAPISSQPM